VTVIAIFIGSEPLILSDRASYSFYFQCRASRELHIVLWDEAECLPAGDYLFSTRLHTLSEARQLEISKLLCKEMQEIYSGRNMP
jgi:hypothetical protein